MKKKLKESDKTILRQQAKKRLTILKKKPTSFKKTLSTPEDDQVSIEVVKSFQKEALPISKKISSLKIESQHDYSLAEELLDKLKTMSKKAVKNRKSMTGPLKKVVKRIEAHFKPFIDSIALIEKDTKQKMAEFYISNQKQAKVIEVKFESGKMKPKAFVQSIQNLQVVTGKSQIRTLQKLEIIDAAKIPKKYLIIDEAMIEKDLKAGIKVPGCKLVEKPNIAI